MTTGNTMERFFVSLPSNWILVDLDELSSALKGTPFQDFTMGSEAPAAVAFQMAEQGEVSAVMTLHLLPGEAGLDGAGEPITTEDGVEMERVSDVESVQPGESLLRVRYRRRLDPGVSTLVNFFCQDVESDRDTIVGLFDQLVASIALSAG